MRIILGSLTLTLLGTTLAALVMAGAGNAHAADTSGTSSGAYSGTTTVIAGDSLATPRGLLGQGRYAEAASLLRSITASEPYNADAFNLLGYSSRKSGDYATAESAYATALSLNPNHMGALEYQGELFLQTGRHDQARANLARLEALCPAGCQERADLAAAIARAY